MLSDDGRARVAQQLIVVEQTSGDGILDGEHADGRGVLLDAGKDFLESAATDELYLFSLEKQVCCNVVERPDESLNGYSLHIFFPICKTNPAFTCL
jgi:hypothetical protein